MKTTQISVFLENKSGRLAEVARVLGDNKVNMRALCVADTADFGVHRMVVDQPEQAFKVLQDNGFAASKTDVLAAEVSDKPGGLAHILEALAARDINVEYMYCFVERAGQAAIDIFRVEQIDDAIEALKSAGVNLVSSDRLYGM
jgi:hypothetical protein